LLDKFTDNFRKALQSANINFLIGSGCSFPCIPILGNIEQKITDEINKGNNKRADRLLVGFLTHFVNFLNLLKSDDEKFRLSLENHVAFIGNIGNLLFQRKSNILHKQASVFSTNYDLFFELAFEKYSDSLILCDGFKRSSYVSNKSYFSISEYFNTVYNIGNVYNYQVEIPSINLIKLHGSLNWYANNNKILNSISYLKNVNKLLNSDTPDDDMNELFNSFSLVLPRKDKFKETIINQTYYDLLRIFANELDKENTLLIAEGFSFADEHIYEVVKRGLRNPTLKLIIFCYDNDSLVVYKEKFNPFNNVEVIFSMSKNIDFEYFNSIFQKSLPNCFTEIDLKNIGNIE